MEFTQGMEELIRNTEPMAMHTWFQLGGPAEFYAEPSSLEELQAIVARCRETDTPMR